jgi:hypothetical protein
MAGSEGTGFVKTGEIDEHGNIVKEREIKHSEIDACPHKIMVPEHYSANGKCRCADKSHAEMEQWGYKWDGKSWVAP